MAASLHPDPEKGVFETMLVLAGRPVELDAHMERLSRSIEALYGCEPPAAAAREEILKGAHGLDRSRLRVTVAPGDSGSMGVAISTAKVEEEMIFPAWQRGVELRSYVVEGGLGDHKWADRRLLERAAAKAPAGELPLLLDSDGTVLEASRGSLFSVRDGKLATPPADGRILPGIARRAAIEVTRAGGIEMREEELTPADLRRGNVFLTGSLRGVEPVRSIDGVSLPRPGTITLEIAGDLRRRWSREPRVEPAAAVAAGPRRGLPAR